MLWVHTLPGFVEALLRDYPPKEIFLQHPPKFLFPEYNSEVAETEELYGLGQ